MTNAAWLAELPLPQLQRELMFTASALCFAQIEVLRGPNEPHCTYRCRECGLSERTLNQLRHCAACKVGEVHAVLLALASLEPADASPASPKVDAVQSTHERSLRTESSCEPVVAAAALAGDQPRPFLLPLGETLPVKDCWHGAYGEPFAVEPTGEVTDARGITVVDPQGCDLSGPDDAALMQRITACVNFCEGVPTDYLRRAALDRTRQQATAGGGR